MDTEGEADTCHKNLLKARDRLIVASHVESKSRFGDWRGTEGEDTKGESDSGGPDMLETGSVVLEARYPLIVTSNEASGGICASSGVPPSGAESEPRVDVCSGIDLCRA